MRPVLSVLCPLLLAAPALAESSGPLPPTAAPPVAAPAAAAPAAAAAAPPVAAPAQAAPPAATTLPEPTAGYNQGSFFLRDPNGWFVLFPKGRLQVDGYTFPARGDLAADVADNGAHDPRPRNTIFVRRARAELVGTIARHFDFSIAGEFGTVPSVGQYGTVTDSYVIVNYTPWARLQVGQYDIPFTLENRTSDKYFDFMERSLVVRAFSVPANKDNGAMVWGYAPNKVAYYSLGVFNGDGQSFKNQDNLPAIIGRAFVAPLAPWAKGRRWMEELEVGASLWWQRNRNLGGAVAPSVTGSAQNDLAAMTTQGGFTFFSSSYGNGTDAVTHAAIRSHLAPDGDTFKWGLEAHLPWQRYGIKWELVHQSIELAQYNDTNPVNAQLLRSAPITGGKLDGLGTYVELYAWVLGGREAIEPPGIEPMPRLDFKKLVSEPTWNVMVAARWDHLQFDVSGLPAGASGEADPAQGHYTIDALELGVNGWLTKHVRLTANYVANFVGGFSPRGATDAANTDAKNLRGNFYYGRVEHELLFRAGIAL